MSPRVLNLHIRAALIVGAAVVAASPAVGADLDYGYGEAQLPVPETKVEFGSGWYVRGDIGATRLPKPYLTPPSTIGQAPDLTISSSSKLGYVASLGGGYAVNNWFRTDITGDVHQPTKVTQYGNYFPASKTAFTYAGQIYYPSNSAGTCQTGYANYVVDSADSFSAPYFENCTSNYQGSITSYDVLFNGYIDLYHWGPVTPYVGAGVGLSFGRYSVATAYYQMDGTPYNVYYSLPGGNSPLIHGYIDARVSGTYYNFAYAAMAGVSVDVYNHVKLDVGYRYLNLGKVLNANLTSQEIRAGLRYMIDN